MKAGKITIEIPAGKTKEEVEKIFGEVIFMIREDLCREKASENDGVLKDYRWPMDKEAPPENS